jgi:hypothetical protein
MNGAHLTRNQRPRLLALTLLALLALGLAAGWTFIFVAFFLVSAILLFHFYHSLERRELPRPTTLRRIANDRIRERRR